MNRQMTCGTSSISFQNPVFVQSCASVVSRKEGEGPLGAYFDTICEDPMFGTDTWEAAESTLQKQAALLAKFDAAAEKHLTGQPLARLHQEINDDT